MKKSEQNQGIYGNLLMIQKTNIWIMGDPEGEERERKWQRAFLKK